MAETLEERIADKTPTVDLSRNRGLIGVDIDGKGLGAVGDD